MNSSSTTSRPLLGLDVFSALDCLPPLTGNDSSVPSITSPLCFTPDSEGRFVAATVAVVGSRPNPSGSPGQTDTLVTAADAVKVEFSTLATTSEQEERSVEWEADMEDLLKDQARRLASHGLVMRHNLQSSLDRDLEASQGNDIILVVITFVLLTNFAIGMNTSRDGVISRTTLAFAGVAAAGLAIPPTFGLMNYLGVPNIALVGFAPFLVLAIGVDDVFVLISAYNKTNPKSSVADRMADTLAEAGVGITITSLTDALAFGIGGTSLFPSVQIFCAYSGTALLVVYLLILTLFVPVMVWDARREAAGISNHTCRKVQRDEQDQTTPSDSTASSATASPATTAPAKASEDVEDGFSDDNPMRSGGSTPAPSKAQPVLADLWEPLSDLLVPAHDYVGKWMDRAAAATLGPAITSPPAVIAVLVVYAGLIALGVVGIMNLPQGLKLKQLSPDTSQLVQYWDNDAAYFSSRVGMPIDVVYTADLQYTAPATRALLVTAAEGLADLPLIESRDVTWVEAYEAFLGPSASSQPQTLQQLHGNLTTFLTTPAGGPYRTDFALDNAATGERFAADDVAGPVAAVASGAGIRIAATRVTIRTVPFGDDTVKQADILITVRRKVADQRVDLGLGSSFAYSPAFIFFEQFESIVSSTVSTLATAVAAMLAIAVVLLPDAMSVLLVTLNVLTIDLGLFASMWMFDIPLSTISMINLVLAIGLAVDASAHVAHAQLHAKGFALVEKRTSARPIALPAGVDIAKGVEGWFAGDSRRFRAVEALTEMGRPVFNGVGSTLVALVPVAFSSSYIFRTFASMNAITLILSLLHAQFILPVMLYLVGPPRIAHDATVADASFCGAASAEEPAPTTPPPTSGQRQAKKPATPTST